MIFSLAIFTAFTEIAAAQSATATLSGTVVDEQGDVVAGASVKITDIAKAFERTITANDVGYFIFSQLPPSSYAVNIGRSGFGGAQLNDLVLNVNDQRVLRVQLKVATATATVDVIAESALVDDSPAVSTIVDRQFVENQPLNGRSFQTLVELAPGVVLTPSSNPIAGQFSVNGQRTGSNYFTVDGVSANFGSTASVTLYESAGGGVPSYSALGTTSSLASVDAVQEFSIQTSTYAPEFGRQPGGQISLVTRSGTNNYHGSVFNYLRNDIFDAANYFDNRAGLSKPIVRGRSATPVNVVSNVNRFNLGTATVLRPDLVAGQPLYADDVNAPGGRRFNRLAFVIPAATENRQGNFGRNVLRGFPAYQLDMSLRRTFGITEAVNLQFRVDAFNVFNRANFANPSGILSDTANFGRSTRTLGEQLAGLSQLYQIGGPRSFQLSAKLRF